MNALTDTTTWTSLIDHRRRSDTWLRQTTTSKHQEHLWGGRCVTVKLQPRCKPKATLKNKKVRLHVNRQHHSYRHRVFVHIWSVWLEFDSEQSLSCSDGHEPRWAVCVCNTEGPGCLGVTVSWRKTCHGRGWRRKKREVQHCELKMGRRLTRRGLTLWILHKQKWSVRFLNKVHIHNAQWWLTWLLRVGRSQDLAVALLLWLKFPLLQGHTELWRTSDL